MVSEVCVPIATTTFLELVDFLREQGSKRDPIEVVDMAIAYWIANASWNQHDLLPDANVVRATEPNTGYVWKTLWIPDGAEARMTYKGRLYSGKVSPNGIAYDGRDLSPSEFVFEITRTSRNAWKDIEFRFPGSARWKLADDLRRSDHSA